MAGLITTKLGGLALVALVLLLVLRQVKPEWGSLVRLAVAVVAAGVVVGMVSTVTAFAEELAVISGGGWDGETWAILVKALGVAFLCEVTASVCRDGGESGLASWVEMAGRVEILLLSLPLIRTVFDTVADLLSGG